MTPLLPILTHCIRVYCILIHTGKGEGDGDEPKRRLEGATVYKAGSKIPTRLTVSPHAPVYKL
jgi:hypothetical protein